MRKLDLNSLALHSGGTTALEAAACGLAAAGACWGATAIMPAIGGIAFCLMTVGCIIAKDPA